MAETDSRDDDRLSAARARLLEAALPNVAFDGWSDATLRRAASITGDDMALARLAFPRGGIDMALAFHRDADRQLAEALDRADLGSMRIRDRITFAVRKRIEIIAREREAVRRGASLMALPLNTPEGARAIWETADLIWNRAGDMSTDYNWYTKRAILSSVLSSTMLYWLGDESTDFSSTWSFLDRRIENVMAFEKRKAAFAKNPIARAMSWGPRQILRFAKAPGTHGVRPDPGGRAYAEEWNGMSPVSVGDPLPD
ncbi:MAG TPA: COQ9 family protein [Paracoccaceae bacterium]|nr:COQ9 family protein [Paracoccaceae bacterium]